ncbi:DNA methyltransferase [Helicobacter sp. L8]|uniref:DNA methyltransferase n=1 Tax=Helicobacter sp. L8 TaxID=2316078 RepID=UPI000EB0238D|nr:DNA methyltransferase [Helicobacter sp. L8]
MLEPYLNQVFHADALEFMGKLPNDCIDCVLIDPPYCSGGAKSLRERAKSTNDKYLLDHGKGIKYPEFLGDGKDQRVWIKWMTFLGIEFKRVLKPSGYFFSFIDWRMLPALSDAVQLADLSWRGIIVWDKGRGVRPFRGGFMQQCEFIVWGTRPMLLALLAWTLVTRFYVLSALDALASIMRVLVPRCGHCTNGG